MSLKHPRSCQNEIDDDFATPNFVFSGNDTFPRFLVIQSQDSSNSVTSLSPFVNEKQIESLIGTPKSVKKLKTLFAETNRKSQTENLKVTSFFNLKVLVSEHNSRNSSKGIIRDRMLKGESEDSIVEYLRPQGVTGCKRFKIKKDGRLVETSTLLLTFDRVNAPKSLKIFYRVVPVDVHVPNPLRCFNCQRFGHHENNCPEDLGSVCDNCGADGHARHTSQCKNPINVSIAVRTTLQNRSLVEEKAIMKLKVTNNVSCLEAKKVHENKPETTFSKIVQSIARPEMKDASTQYKAKDCKITTSTKVIEPKVKSTSKSTSGSQSSQSSSGSQSSASFQSSSQSQSSSQPSSSSESQSGSRSQSLLPQAGGVL